MAAVTLALAFVVSWVMIYIAKRVWIQTETP